MAENRRHDATSEGILNTLAQNGSTQAVIIQGVGSEYTNEKVMKGRAKRKVIAQSLALALIDIAREKGNTELMKAFWNTYHCQSNLVTYRERIFGKYCKNRHCPLCCSIRKAVLINKYLPIIEKWPNPHFVTLTVRSCTSQSLKKRLHSMIRGFKKITTEHRKKYGAAAKFRGIRCLECCFNPVKRTYNPHFHILVPDKATAEIFIAKWLEICTPKFALRKGQDMRPVKDLEKGLIEIIKYGAKIFTEPDIDKKLQGNVNPTIYAGALYNIFDGMKGLRLFERFGFNLPHSETITIPARTVINYQEWYFMPEYQDWIGIENEQVLSNYLLPLDLAELLNNHIDKSKE